MRSNKAVVAVVLGASVAALCTSACKKASDETHRRPGSEANIHSARVVPPTESAASKNDFFATVRREQLQLRARIQEDIAEVDARLAELGVGRRNGQYVIDPNAKNAARVRELLARRHRLEEHAATVERADERGWDELKATVEQDLRN